MIDIALAQTRTRTPLAQKLTANTMGPGAKAYGDGVNADKLMSIYGISEIPSHSMVVPRMGCFVCAVGLDYPITWPTALTTAAGILTTDTRDTSGVCNLQIDVILLLITPVFGCVVFPRYL